MSTRQTRNRNVGPSPAPTLSPQPSMEKFTSREALSKQPKKKSVREKRRGGNSARMKHKPRSVRGSKRDKRKASAEKVQSKEAEALKRMADRAKKKMSDKQKKEKEKATEKSKVKTRKGDDTAFPKNNQLKTTEEVSKIFQIQPVATPAQAAAANIRKTYLAETEKNAKKNNDNNGQLMIKDPETGKEKPFWHSDELYQQESVAEDEIVLNAETLVNVANNTIQLAKSDVDWPANCDPHGKLSTLQEKDDAAFKNAIIYGNSVRSMMNVEKAAVPEITATDPEQRRIQEAELQAKKATQGEEYVLRQLRFVEPKMARVYDANFPSTNMNLRLEPFTPPEEKKLSAT